MAYIRRSLESAFQKAASQFPAVVLTGPRQSGKTTLLRHILGDSVRYVSFDAPDMQLAASSDPRGFLDYYRAPVILDEVQHVPGLLPYIKERVDLHRQTPGQYFLSGSQNLLLNQHITESLAGRAAILTLLPLSAREIAGRPDARLPWEVSLGEGVFGDVPPGKERLSGEVIGNSEKTSGNESPAFDSDGPGDNRLETTWQAFLRGGFPELTANPRTDPDLWFSSYIRTYLERDVRSLRQIGDLSQFQMFLKMLAGLSGSLLNLNAVARDIGVAFNTLKQWMSLLEATYQIHVLRPYHANISKRLVKTPKVYMSDTGLMCSLLGIRSVELAMNGPISGAIVETAVINEVMRTMMHRGVKPDMYFWRTATGVEVDLLVEDNGRLIPVEIKKSSTPGPSMGKAIASFRADVGEKAGPGFLIHLGGHRLPLGKDLTAWPLTEI